MTTNISKLIDIELDQTDEADPRVIADRVAAMVPGRELRTALGDALVGTVREHMRRDRNAMPYVPASANPKSVGRSRRERARDSFLHDRINAGVAGWKLLGDCTVEDLRLAANFRRDQAKGNLANADKIDALADAVERSGKKTVRAVPLDVTLTIWSS